MIGGAAPGGNPDGGLRKVHPGAHPCPQFIVDRVSAPRTPLIYNAVVLDFARTCMTVMTWLFFVGAAGSLLVVIISFFEDLTELVGKE